MIGNDVIDLALAQQESNWQRKGYLDKVFTPKEQNLIFSSDNPTIMVWILWSRKEAVYKIIRQENGKRGFYPLRIKNSNYELGQVSYETGLFYVKTSIVDDCIHSIALLNQSFDQIIEISSSTPILKNDGIPFIIKNRKYIHVSKSHHGRFTKLVRII